MTHQTKITVGTLTTSHITSGTILSGVYTVNGLQSIRSSPPKHTANYVELPDLRKELQKILQGCGGKRTSQIIDSILRLIDDGFSVVLSSEYKCTHCGQSGCTYMTPECQGWNNTHEECADRQSCWCSCHSVTKQQVRDLREDLLDLHAELTIEPQPQDER